MNIDSARNNIALVLLAAGGSTRMGTPKQLLSYKGQPLIRHAAQTALDSGCDPVIVVLGCHIGEIRAALDGLNVVVVENTEWDSGMGTSIRAGISAAEIMGCDGAILALADQPLITAGILKSLMAEYADFGKADRRLGVCRHGRSPCILLPRILPGAENAATCTGLQRRHSRESGPDNPHRLSGSRDGYRYAARLPDNRGQRGGGGILTFHMGKSFFRALSFVCASVCACVIAFSQGTTSRVVGTVQDATGAVIPGATVKLINPGTNVTFTTTSSGGRRICLSRPCSQAPTKST